MTRQFSTISLQIRWLAIILGMVFIFWIPIEDTSTTLPLIFAILLGTLGAFFFLSGGKKPFHLQIFNYVLAGLLAGLSITPIALFLMAFKTGLHGHQAPDFSRLQILSIIYRSPIWLIGGLLAGLGGGVWATYVQSSTDQR